MNKLLNGICLTNRGLSTTEQWELDDLMTLLKN